MNRQKFYIDIKSLETGRDEPVRLSSPEDACFEGFIFLGGVK